MWSRLPGSNWGPTVYKTVALPTELSRRYEYPSTFFLSAKPIAER